MKKILGHIAATAAIKDQLGYSESRCELCCHYEGTDISGSPGALSSHCTLCSPVLIEVSYEGHCDHFHPKASAEMKAKTAEFFEARKAEISRAAQAE